jgi:hypothetical protein
VEDGSEQSGCGSTACRLRCFWQAAKLTSGSQGLSTRAEQACTSRRGHCTDTDACAALRNAIAKHYERFLPGRQATSQASFALHAAAENKLPGLLVFLFLHLLFISCSLNTLRDQCYCLAIVNSPCRRAVNNSHGTTCSRRDSTACALP